MRIVNQASTLSSRRPRRGLLPVVALVIISLFGLRAGSSQTKTDSPWNDCPGPVFRFHNLTVRAEKSAVLVEPGAKETLRFFPRNNGYEIKVESCKGASWCKPKGAELVLDCPAKSGNYKLELKLVQTSTSRGVPRPPTRIGQVVTLWVLVGYPSSLLHNGVINGFELGLYPDPAETGNAAYYQPPAFFYHIEYRVMGAFISEHIRLGDLAYDGRAPLPQYSALDLELPRKLEVMVEELRRRKLPSRVHFIGGGFISPKSNIKRTQKTAAAATLSRHMWGEAVDFIIDEKPQDGIMDDMNGDHIIDVRDAFVVRDVITDLEKSGRVKAGGVGVYAPPTNSQIQLHVDVRGHVSRWGVKKFDPEIYGGAPAVRSLRPGG